MTSRFTRNVMVILLFLFAPVITRAQSLKITLLGTGNPGPSLERFGPSTLIEAGDERLLFDCGRGVPQRVFQLKIPFSHINALFLTHLHSDHVLGIPDLWLTGWVLGRDTPLRLWGPTGTKDMTTNLQNAYEADIRIRIADEGLPKEGATLVANDITVGVVYENKGIKITAFEVDHGDLIKPAFGYRIDYAGRSVVLSGDTRPSEKLIEMSRGVDALIHEVATVPPAFLIDQPQAPALPPWLSRQRLRQIVAHHSTPEQAGQIFATTKPKLAVYSHIVLFGGLTVNDLINRTRSTYAGPLEVGEDLMVIDVGETVKVTRPTQ